MIILNNTIRSQICLGIVSVLNADTSKFVRFYSEDDVEKFAIAYTSATRDGFNIKVNTSAGVIIPVDMVISSFTIGTSVLKGVITRSGEGGDMQVPDTYLHRGSYFSIDELYLEG